MATERKCGKCKGSGTYRYASGAEGNCSRCSGKGAYTPATAEEKAARKNWQDAWITLTALRRGGDATAPEGVPFYTFRSGVLAGLEALAEREPQRLPKLYASLAAGRLQAVATALYDYAKGC